jgi:hypothetical protein
MCDGNVPLSTMSPQWLRSTSTRITLSRLKWTATDRFEPSRIPNRRICLHTQNGQSLNSRLYDLVCCLPLAPNSQASDPPILYVKIRHSHWSRPSVEHVDLGPLTGLWHIRLLKARLCTRATPSAWGPYPKASHGHLPKRQTMVPETPESFRPGPKGLPLSGEHSSGMQHIR